MVFKSNEKNLLYAYANNLHFMCNYSDDEIEKIADLCLVLLEELRCINNAGYTGEQLSNSEKSMKTNESFTGFIKLYNSFKSKKTDEIIDRLSKITRVGGAYYMILSRPTFISGICSVYGLIIDNFENARLYFSALYMLIRIAMHMHCDEI